MAEVIQEVIATIDGLSHVDGTDDLSRLQRLADCYFTDPGAADHLDVWFRLYERFPEDEGCGVFWSILHGVEAQPGFERLVVDSIRRKPSLFPLLMLNRLLNGGARWAAGVELLVLLCQVAADQRCLPGVRAGAQRFLDHQRSRAQSAD